MRKLKLVVLYLCFANALVCFGVNSKLTRHSSSQAFLKGEVNNVVISSRGNMQLGRDAQVLVEQFEDVWSINSIVVIGDAVYIGTSPNGGVYQYSAGKLKKIYSAKASAKAKPADAPTKGLKLLLVK